MSSIFVSTENVFIDIDFIYLQLRNIILWQNF